MSTLMLISFIIYNTFLKWILFKKANKKSVYALIPLYSDLILFDIARLSKAYIILYAVCIGLLYMPVMTLISQFLGSIIIFILTVYFCIRLARAYDQSEAFGIGIFLLSPVFLSIIAFNDEIEYKYNKK